MHLDSRAHPRRELLRFRQQLNCLDGIAVNTRQRCDGCVGLHHFGCTGRRHVCFGSKADTCGAKGHVRFAPNSDRKSGLRQTIMSALPPNSGHCRQNAAACSMRVRLSGRLNCMEKTVPTHAIGRGNDPTYGESNELFPWWSITKTVLAAAVLRLADRGKLSLDNFGILGTIGRNRLYPTVGAAMRAFRAAKGEDSADPGDR